MKRILFTLKKYWNHRKALKQQYLNPKNCRSSATDLLPAQLYEQGIRAMILDLDGVLAFHGDLEVSEDTKIWLNRCVEIFGSKKVFILSNKPSKRRDYFNQVFPSIDFIMGVRKKPYTDGLERVIEKTGLAAEKILLVDDRLFTGILAALQMNMPAIFITHPLVNWRLHPLEEAVTQVMRWIDWILVKIGS